MAEDRTLRRQAAVALMTVAVVAIVAFVALTGNGNSSGAVVLAEDCSADPWGQNCHPPSFMDMINGLGHRAQSNALRQKKVKEQLLAQERLMEKQQADQDAKKSAKESVKGKAEASTKANAKKSAESSKEDSKTALADTKYNGVDIASKKAVDSTMAHLLKTGGKAAVEKKVEEIRQQVLADSGKMFGFGKKAGYLPPPPAIKELGK